LNEKSNERRAKKGKNEQMNRGRKEESKTRENKETS
jgi:hypothetical protein